MNDFYRGRRVWITGASSGIGEALALQLAQRGAELILSARREAVLEQLRARLPQPERHRVVGLDLADAEALYKKVRGHLADGLAVDLLINNAGLSQRGRAEHTHLAVDRKLMEVNYLGTVAMTKAAMPALLASKRGCVATVASVSGLLGSQGRSSYSAAKHALMGFMEALRAEMHDKLQVTLACPGWVNTQISANSLNEVGLPLGYTEPRIAAGISAERCASEILRAIEKGRDQVVIGRGTSAWAPTLKRFLPGLFRFINHRQAYR